MHEKFLCDDDDDDDDDDYYYYYYVNITVKFRTIKQTKLLKIKLLTKRRKFELGVCGDGCFAEKVLGKYGPALSKSRKECLKCSLNLRS